MVLANWARKSRQGGVVGSSSRMFGPVFGPQVCHLSGVETAYRIGGEPVDDLLCGVSPPVVRLERRSGRHQSSSVAYSIM